MIESGDEERGEQLFKGTVDVILSDIPFEEGYVRFTKIYLKLMFEKKLKTIVSKCGFPLKVPCGFKATETKNVILKIERFL